MEEEGEAAAGVEKGGGGTDMGGGGGQADTGHNESTANKAKAKSVWRCSRVKISIGACAKNSLWGSRGASIWGTFAQRGAILGTWAILEHPD